MLLIKTIEKYYYDLLTKQMKVSIYNHVPENAKFPLIKLARISTEPWFLTPFSKVLNINFEIFSTAQSNIECLEILENLEGVIFSEHNLASELHINHQIFDHGEIYQIENDIWFGQLSIKVYVAIKH